MRKIGLFLFFTLLLTAVKAQDSLLYKTRFNNLSNNLGLRYSEDAYKYINLWSKKDAAKMGAAIGMADYYFPYIDSLLKAYKVPTDLKYLALASSFMDFRYFDSSDGARGMWHFNYSTAKLYGLQITSYIDDRLNVQSSTIAFAKALSEYYRIYNSWALSVAAYYSSATKVNKAIRYNNNSFDYWQIRGDLSVGAQEVIPKMIAAIYVYNYATEQKIVRKYFNAPVPAAKIPVTNWVSLEQISSRSGVDLGTLEWLNSEYKRNIIPDVEETLYLVVPKELKDSAKWIQSLYFTPYTVKYYEKPSKDTIWEEKKSVHIVAAGESLQSLATLYSCEVEDLREWNDLEEDEIIPGQELVIITMQVTEKATPAPPKPKPAKPAATAKSKIYTVKSGDTLSSIASRHHCTISELKKWNNLKSDKLRVGQKLKINK